MIHCKAAVGRAGTIAACLIKKLNLMKGKKAIINYLRSQRNPICVESSKQEMYIKEYVQYINSLNAQK